MMLQITDMVAIGILLAVMLMLLAWLIVENYGYKRQLEDKFYQRWYSDDDQDICNVKDCYVCDKENE